MSKHSEILSMVKELKEVTNIKTAIQLLSTKKWIAIFGDEKLGKIVLGRVD